MPKNEIAKEIKTSQSLVHIRHSVSIAQYKYWFLLLKAYKDALESSEPMELDEEGFYFIPISKLSEMLGYEVSKKLLKNDLMALRREDIILNYLEKDGIPVIKGSGFISEWKIKGSKVGVILPTFLLDVLRGDEKAKEMFLLLNWDIFNSFSGKYEAIIYKLCLDYMGLDKVLGYGKTPQMSIDEYRDYIGLADGEYTQFKELNRWTISKPIANINSNDLSDITVEPQFIKKANKVVALYFTAKYKRGRRPLVASNPIKSDQQAFQMADLPFLGELRINLSKRKIQEYVGKYSEDEIKSIINRANSYLDKQESQGKVVKNIAGVYYKAFDEGWSKDDIAQQKAQEEAREKERIEKEAREAEVKKARLLDELKERRRKEAEKVELDTAVLIFESLGKEQQENIIDEILLGVPKGQHILFKPKAGPVDFYRHPPMVFEICKKMKVLHPEAF